MAQQKEHIFLERLVLLAQQIQQQSDFAGLEQFVAELSQGLQCLGSDLVAFIVQQLNQSFFGFVVKSPVDLAEVQNKVDYFESHQDAVFFQEVDNEAVNVFVDVFDLLEIVFRQSLLFVLEEAEQEFLVVGLNFGYEIERYEFDFDVGVLAIEGQSLEEVALVGVLDLLVLVDENLQNEVLLVIRKQNSLLEDGFDLVKWRILTARS